MTAIAPPKGYTFDHTEWLKNSSGRFVATLANADGAHKKIVAVNLETSGIVELVAGEEVPVYNFNTDYYKAFTHDAVAFTDYDSHLNGDAARAFSHVLGQILFGKEQ